MQRVEEFLNAFVDAFVESSTNNREFPSTKQVLDFSDVIYELIKSCGHVSSAVYGLSEIPGYLQKEVDNMDSILDYLKQQISADK